MVLVGFSGYGQNVGDQFTVDSITYKITPQTQVELVGYSGTGTELDIFSMVKNQNDIEYTVTTIGGGEQEHQQPFFQKGLTRVAIPNIVTSIGIGAFNKNKLTEVTIPNGVTRIEKWAFSQNDLKELIIPANVGHIGEQDFIATKTFPP